MKWQVKGASLDTGAGVRETVEAADYPAVQAILKQRRIAAESVRPLEGNGKPAKPPPSAVTSAPSSATPHPVTRIISALFVVSGVLSLVVSAIEKFRRMPSLYDGTVSSMVAEQGAIAASAVRSEYLSIVGGAAVFFGFALLMLRQVAVNTTPR